MSVAITPQGFDDDRKKRAGDVELGLDFAIATLGALAAISSFAFPPLTAGFAVAAAVGPVLKWPFSRIRNDPARPDFHIAEPMRPLALDPTAAMSRGVSADVSAFLVAWSLAADRAGAHLDAMVTAVERAMGAAAAGSATAADLRLVEARFHAVAGRRRLQALAQVARPLADFGDEHFPQLMEMHGQTDTLGEHLRGVVIDESPAIDLVLASGIDERMLERPPLDPGPDPPGGAWAIAEACEEAEAVVGSLLVDFPASLEDFLGEARAVAR